MLKKFSKKKMVPEKEFEVSEPTLFVRNSFCTLGAFPEDIKSLVQDLLTYEDETVEHEVKKTFALMAYWKTKNKTRAVYALRAKIKHLEARRVVCWLKNDSFPTGHLPMVIELLREIRFSDYKLEDFRKLPTNSATLRWRNRPKPMRYYQEEMVALGLKEGRGVFESAVGTGKTLILTNLIKELGVNSLIIVPSVALLEQMQRELSHVFGPNQVCLINTASVKKGKKKLAPLRLTTVQTLASLQEQDLLTEVIGDVDLLAVDEIHHAGADSYTNLLPAFDHIYYRFGFTGTFLRNDSKTLDMWGFLSNLLYHYPPYKATQEGFLTPVEYTVERIEGVRNNNYQKEYDANYVVKSEKGKIQGAQVLMAAIKARVAKIPAKEQILILVDRKDGTGKVIHELLKHSGFDNVYVSGDDKKAVIGDAIEDFNAKKVRIMVGSTVIGEGIDVHSTQHLILANGGKSPIKLVQGIGRCVRLHEGKPLSYVYDFCFEGTRFLEKHCGQRIDVFTDHFGGKILWE